MTKGNMAKNLGIPVKSHKVRLGLNNREETKKTIATAKENPYLCRGYIYKVVILAVYTGLRRGEFGHCAGKTSTWAVGKSTTRPKWSKANVNLPRKMVRAVRSISPTGFTRY